MAQLDLIPLDAEGAWRDALEDIPHGFHHTHDFARATHHTTGHDAFLLSLREGKASMVCSLVERMIAGELDVATASGLSGFASTGSWEWLAPYWDGFVRERGYVCGYIGLHPLFEPRGVGQRAQRHNSIYVLDLNLGLPELLGRMDQNRRRELRGWDERAREFVLDRGALRDFVAANYEPFMRRVGAHAPYLSPESIDCLYRAEGSVIVGTAASGSIESVLILGATGYAGEWLLSVNVGDGKSRTTDLLWHGIRALIEKGVPVLNLGGGGREDDSIARAKQRLGPQRHALRSLQEVYRPAVYAELCRLAAVDHVAPGGYFPAYRSPLAGETTGAAS